MRLHLLTLLLTLFFPIVGMAQENAVLLENAIQVNFEVVYSKEAPFQKPLRLKVYLKNTTEDSIHILKNSCYGLARFIKHTHTNIWISSGISCTISYPTVQTLLPKDSVEFEFMMMHLEDDSLQTEMDIGLELIKVPKEKLTEKANAFHLYEFYEEEATVEKFVFWKRVKGYSFRIQLPLLRI